MRRLIISVAALAALATPASLFVIGGTAPAGATTVPKSLTCTKITGNAGGKVTISGCNVPTADKKTYASASAPKGLALASGGTLTWSTSKKTTVFKITSTVQSGTACAKVKNTGEVQASGHVTGGSAPKAISSANQAVSVKICLNKTTAAISIAPGTTAKL